ncbi:MAG TPA: glycosyltransferase family 2 protein [Cyclobacteriaceae bacterium]|nr:glycosyltransferase family 2 protein [Cyclobacteriaceae bacterium]
MEFIIAIIYSLSLLFLFLFSLGQLHLTWLYLKAKKKENKIADAPAHFKPHVSVQLPVYNEKYVIQRLIEAVSKIDYPKEKLEIQVLDDSTDETTKIAQVKIEQLQQEGLNIQLIRRPERKDFKAGALDYGLQTAKGEFIAIFDADFLPQADFLIKTIPHFADESIGVVQTRWAHINKEYSLFTKLQAFGLDAHFSIEQSGRNFAGSFINFNGTCGVWRKKCIEDAGGWSADTLTEDLDLSYRAQLKGWKFKYLEEVSTPGELPVIMPSIKSQQYRWNKGAAETARKLMRNVFNSDKSFKNKVHAFFHLLNSSVFLFLLMAAVLSIPMLWFKQNHPWLELIFDAGLIFLLGFFSITIYFFVASKMAFGNNILKNFLKYYPVFLIVSMGLSLHNGIAVLEGWLGIKTPFIRTPKFNISKKGESWQGNEYLDFKFSWLNLLEVLGSLYFVIGIAMGFYFKDPVLLLFHAMLAIGFGIVAWQSIKVSRHAR